MCVLCFIASPHFIRRYRWQPGQHGRPIRVPGKGVQLAAVNAGNPHLCVNRWWRYIILRFVCNDTGHESHELTIRRPSRVFVAAPLKCGKPRDLPRDCVRNVDVGSRVSPIAEEKSRVVYPHEGDITAIGRPRRPIASFAGIVGLIPSYAVIAYPRHLFALSRFR